MIGQWYMAAVDYQTAGGRAGFWRGPVFAADEESAIAAAHQSARHNRPRLAKIVGGTIELCPPNDEAAQ